MPSVLNPLAYPPNHLAPNVAQKPISPTYQSGYSVLLFLTLKYSSSDIWSGIIVISFCTCCNNAMRYLFISLPYLLSQTILSIKFAPPTNGSKYPPPHCLHKVGL